MEGYATPQEAARGDIPERFTRVVWCEQSDDRAVVLLEVNAEPAQYFDLSFCCRERARGSATAAKAEWATNVPSNTRSGSPNPARQLSSRKEREGLREGDGGLG
jgi:hypothetical protein